MSDQPLPRRDVLRLVGAITVALPLLAACGVAATVSGSAPEAAAMSRPTVERSSWSRAC